MKQLSILIALICAVLCSAISNDAQAGVLLSSTRVRSSVTFRPMRMRLPRAIKSTFAARRTQPTLSKGNYWGVKDQLAEREAEIKYQEKVQKMQERRLRSLQKKLRQEERKQAKLARKLQRQQEAMLRKQEKQAKLKGKVDADGREITVEGSNLPPNSNEAKSKISSGKAVPEKGKKLSFWARLKRAIFGS